MHQEDIMTDPVVLVTSDDRRILVRMTEGGSWGTGKRFDDRIRLNALKEEIRRHLKTRHRNLDFDWSQQDQISSSGIGMLLYFAYVLKPYKLKVRVIGASERSARTLCCVAMGHFLDVRAPRKE